MAEISIRPKEESQTIFDLHGFLIEEEEGKCSGCSDVVVDEKDGGTISRGTLWTKLLCANEKKEENMNIFDYQKSVIELEIELKSLGWECHQELSCLVNCVDNKMAEYKDDDPPEKLCTIRQILMDVGRTFPNHKMFMTDNINKFHLFRILYLYTWHNKETGYCQGMAYVVALLKMYIDYCEEDVFWCFVYLLDNQLQFFYEKDLKRIKVLAEVVRTVLNEKVPELGSQLELLGIHPLMYATQWFMGFFTGLNCWDTVLYIAELVFREGSHHLLNSAIAILLSCTEQVLEMSKLEEVLPFLQNIPSSLIHQRCIQDILRNNLQFQNFDEMNEYLVVAERKVTEEDNRMDQIHRSRSQKRQRNEIEGNKMSHPLFKSAKKFKTNSSTISSITTPNYKTIPITPQTKPSTRQIIKTSTINKSALDSVKKGHAELCYTNDTGLIYTSPNTMEMKSLKTGTTQSTPAKDKENRELIAMKLAFVCDTPKQKNTIIDDTKCPAQKRSIEKNN